MKAAGALIALASLATILLVAFAVRSNRDDVPGDLRDCVTEGRASVVKGPANLGGARREIAAKTLTRVRTVRDGDNRVFVLAGERFRLLVLVNESSPPLEADLPKQLYEHADDFPLVAIETDPVRDVLVGCAGLIAG